MTDRPIIFSALMVQALLDGRKTMTRRLACRQVQDKLAGRMIDRPSLWQSVRPGDRLWVRESLQCFNRATAQYVADITPVAAVGAVERAIDGRAKWTWKQAKLPSIHMPRWASRLTLIVTATKIERLQMIRNADILAEGVAGEPPQAAMFAALWVSVHGPGSWDANPEVVAISFTVHRGNVDALSEAA